MDDPGQVGDGKGLEGSQLPIFEGLSHTLGHDPAQKGSAEAGRSKERHQLLEAERAITVVVELGQARRQGVGRQHRALPHRSPQLFTHVESGHDPRVP